MYVCMSVCVYIYIYIYIYIYCQSLCHGWWPFPDLCGMYVCVCARVFYFHVFCTFIPPENPSQSSAVGLKEQFDQLKEQFDQLKEQFDQLKEQFDQLKEQFDQSRDTSHVNIRMA